MIFKKEMRCKNSGIILWCIYPVILMLYFIIIPGAGALENPGIKRMGLFIASDYGGPERSKLKYALSDAKKLARVFRELGGLSDRDYHIIHNPNQAELLDSLNYFREEIRVSRKKDIKIEFFLYYSGHSDEQGLLLDSEQLLYKDLKKSISTLKSDMVVLILDSCASGTITRYKGGKMASPFSVDYSAQSEGQAIITSSSDNEASQESENLRGSFFTYYFTIGLRGAADVDRDNRVTFNEAYKYAYDETLKKTEGTFGGPQHPSYHLTMTGHGDLVLTYITLTNSGLILESDLEGRVYVRDRLGKLILEFTKEKGKEMTVAVPAGKYSVNLYNKDKTYTCKITIQHDEKENISSEFVLIVKNKETTLYKGLVVEIEQEQEKTSYFSWALGYHFSLPLDEFNEDSFAPGHMPLFLLCHFNFSKNWGILSLEFFTGIDSKKLDETNIYGFDLYSFPLGLGLRYRTHWNIPFFLLLGISGGITFNYIDYWDNVEKDDYFFITPIVISALGGGYRFAPQITLFSQTTLLVLLFEKTQYVAVSPGFFLEFSFR